MAPRTVSSRGSRSVNRTQPQRSSIQPSGGKLWLRIRRHWQVYVFLFVPIVYLLIFHYYPMTGIQLAFKDFIYKKGIWGSPWVGLRNFTKFFNSFMFSRVVVNTVSISLYSMIAGFPIPIIFALLLNSFRHERFKRSIQTITYMPHFISVVVLVGMLFQVLNPRSGLFGTVAHALTGSYPKDILGSAANFTHLYVWSDIWQNFGWGSIIYLAALSGVSPELHEAATVDGASRFQRVLHIDIPGILPTAIIMLILRTGSIMTVGFEKVLLMQNTLNLSRSEVISTYVYKVGLTASIPDYPYATAIGLFNSVINLALLSTVNAVAKRTGETSLW
jgi:putative aldouronate transport system permease protein